MAKIIVMASGSGSNFQAIAEAFQNTKHEISGLICDRKDAYAFNRAEKLNIISHHISYYKKDKIEAEKEIINTIKLDNPDLIILAGFMRILGSLFIDAFSGKIINIHPSLLPKYPGTHGIVESYNSTDTELGISIHKVDYGMDTGPIIMQKSFKRTGTESLDEIEEKIHSLEHKYYPKAILNILDTIS